MTLTHSPILVFSMASKKPFDCGGGRLPRRLKNYTIRLALLSLAVLGSLPQPVQSAERNIILVVTDDESPTLGCYGDRVAATPAVDALAADGTMFVNAFATTASCSPSRAAILSGLHHHANGQYGLQHDFNKFTGWHDVVGLSLPRALARGGYRTARVGKFHVAPAEVYHFDTVLQAPDRNPVAMAEACKEVIEAADDRPFFLYFATADPHRSGHVDEAVPLERKPDLFGNRSGRESHAGVEEVFFDPATVPVPAFLPDTPETRSELAHYYQSCTRVDRGLARLVELLRAAGLYDKTLIVFTSDHGMAFAGAKTTVYEPGLRVPLVVRDPYVRPRGTTTTSFVSLLDITPSLLDFAGELDTERRRPRHELDPREYWRDKPQVAGENLGPRKGLATYQGGSWLPILSDPDQMIHDTHFASHTFHEVQMYYPMRAVRDREWKLIWNIAHPLPFPFASDLWAASSWQAQLAAGPDAAYGPRTVAAYMNRPRFELYHLTEDPQETRNLADDPAHAETLQRLRETLEKLQRETGDPWIRKWDHE